MAAGEFDVNGFERTKFVPRTREVAAPQMAEWFKGGDPVFVLRGLTFDERIRCEAFAMEARRDAAEALAKLAFDQGDKDTVKNIQDALGWGESTQPATRVSVEKVCIALMSPKLSRPVVSMISRSFPAVFGGMLEAVHVLTDQGQEVEKKSLPSGQTPESAQA